MPSRLGKKRPDLNELAAQIVNESTCDEPPEEEPKPADGEDPAAVALGRKGRLKGGKGRAEKMTPEERSEAARKAAAAGWKKRQPGT